MGQQEIGWSIEAKLLAQIKSLIARSGGSSTALLQFANLASFPPTGATGAIYLALDTNKIYYWDGSSYVEMAGSGSAIAAYATFGDFPTPGATGVIYIALDTNRLYRWDAISTSYVEVSPATDAIVVVGAGLNSSLRCGSSNSTTGAYSTAFGRNNTSSGPYSSIFGQDNTASGQASTVMAGYKNQAQGSFSTIGGGICNNVCNSTSECLAIGATILGGIGNNTINGAWDLASCAFLVAPTICNAGAYSTIGGGFQNRAAADYTTVFGGYKNISSGLVSAVGGGTTNTASGACSFIGGGKTNTSSGSYSSILGGANNDTANFANAMIVGSNITATQANTTFVNCLSAANLSTGSSVCVGPNGILINYTPISGSGTSGQVTYWNGTSSVTGSSNLFWDNANGRLGIGTSSPGYKLDVSGDTLIKGSGTTSSTFALLVTNNSNTNIFRVRNDGQLRIANEIVAENGSLLTLTSFNNLQGISFNSGNFFSRTSGESNFLFMNVYSNPTSGTGVFNTFKLNPAINQTGGANGITRGLYINPTLTAAADWRSLEWSNNSGYGIYGAGTASNYVAGNFGFQQTSPTAIVDIGASTTSKSSLRIRSGAAPTTPNDGDIWFDGTDLKIRVAGSTKTFTIV